MFAHLKHIKAFARLINISGSTWKVYQFHKPLFSPRRSRTLCAVSGGERIIAKGRKGARAAGFGSSVEAQGECQAGPPAQPPGRGLAK